MRQALLIASLLCGTTLSYHEPELRSIWPLWKELHGKTYSQGEDDARFAIFMDNYKKVLKFNAEHDNLRLGLNKFADLTPHEFKALHSMCGFKETNQELIAENTLEFDENDAQDIPDTFDWRPKGAVTYVKDQGQCGSCWAFSATGVLEGYYFLKYGKLLQFSEQQIVSCDTGGQGCDGGYPYQALEYTVKGLDQEKDYPYKEATTKCNFDPWKALKINTGYQFVTANSTVALKTAIVSQPVSVSIEADQDVFQLYDSGVIQGMCGADLDHAVLAVGYEKGAFIVKNSWGTDWGMDGYVYISDDNKDNDGQGVCGILAQPVIAI